MGQISGRWLSWLFIKLKTSKFCMEKSSFLTENFLNNQSTWEKSGDVIFSEFCHISHRCNMSLPAAAVVAGEGVYNGHLLVPHP